MTREQKIQYLKDVLSGKKQQRGFISWFKEDELFISTDGRKLTQEEFEKRESNPFFTELIFLPSPGCEPLIDY